MPMELLYADDLAICSNSKEELQSRLLNWQSALEKGGLKMNAKKTVVMVSGSDEVLSIKDVHGHLLEQVKEFKYLGSLVSAKGGCADEIRERVKAAWASWKKVAGVVCDKKMPKDLKGRVYKAVVRPALLYGSECWALNKGDVQKLNTTEMRMIRWWMGMSLKEHRMSDDIRRDANIDQTVSTLW